MRLLLLTLACACLLQVSVAVANTSHDGWPDISGVTLMNKNDDARPLDARPGHDPFAGQDTDYTCDEVHMRAGGCQNRFVDSDGGDGQVMGSRAGHNELLGGHGSDTIHAGPWGDVIWGDYHPSGQPTGQHDRLYGGPARDFIYASHGTNTIKAGGGNDWIKAHFGRGSIDCGGGKDLLYISHKAMKRHKIRHCETISHKTLGY